MKKLTTILIATFFICTVSYGATIKELLGLGEKKSYAKCKIIGDYWHPGFKKFEFIAFENEGYKQKFFIDYSPAEKEFLHSLTIDTREQNKSLIKTDVASIKGVQPHWFKLELNKNNGQLSLKQGTSGKNFKKFDCKKIDKKSLPKSIF